MMKRKRVFSCLWCGMRIGASKKPFCIQESSDLMVKKHMPHYFQWNWLHNDYFGQAIIDLIPKLNHLDKKWDKDKLDRRQNATFAGCFCLVLIRTVLTMFAVFAYTPHHVPHLMQFERPTEIQLILTHGFGFFLDKDLCPDRFELSSFPSQGNILSIGRRAQKQ